ncbi:MAG: hypothetical protein QXE96_02015 [Candidatus Caldarchaeum sp.]
MLKAVFEGPTPLSSIFSPKVLDGDKVRGDPDTVGALGGGFSFFPGVKTVVEIREGDGLSIKINGEPARFPPSEKAVEVMRELAGVEGHVRISHSIHVPIAMGFGTSAAAALGVLMSLSRLVGRPFTLREALKHTHRVEVLCKTGLNSEAGFGHTGLVLVLKEGSPDRTVVDEIPLPPKTKLIAVAAKKTETPDAISSVERLRQLETIGDRYMDKILRNPTPENFLKQARAFAYEAGFVDDTVHQLFNTFDKLPTIGYAQNMVGKAVHAIVYEEDVEKIVETLKKTFPNYPVYVGVAGASLLLKTE